MYSHRFDSDQFFRLGVLSVASAVQTVECLNYCWADLLFNGRYAELLMVLVLVLFDGQRKILYFRRNILVNPIRNGVTKKDQVFRRSNLTV